MTQEQYVLSARDIINNLLEAIPKQTENADWWEDSLTNAVHNAKVFVEETISPAATASDYEEVLEDHRRLVRELDVILNGEGAAKQASLCDIVAQLKKQRQAPAATVRGAEEMLKEAEKIFKGMRDSPKDGAGLHYIKKTVFWEDLESFIKRYMSQSGYTLAQVSDAWDECDKWKGYVTVAELEEKKTTFLNSLKTPEIKCRYTRLK